jgi:hypothetical protein
VLIDGTCTSTPCPAELIKGKVSELSTSSLVIDDGRVRHDLAVAKIAFVERRRDPIWNGMLIGFAVGFTAGFVAVYDGDECGGWFCGFSGPGFAAGVGLLSGGIGAGVGALTDAVTTDRRIIFARSPAKAPPTAQSARGIGFTVRF